MPRTNRVTPGGMVFHVLNRVEIKGTGPLLTRVRPLVGSRHAANESCHAGRDGVPRAQPWGRAHAAVRLGRRLLAFENILEETFVVQPMRLLSYCLMPNHWHFVLWPKEDGDLAAFMQRLTVTHVTRWQRHKKRVGYGHVYQGRFKSFPGAIKGDRSIIDASIDRW